MSDDWELIGQIPQGGTVGSVTSDDQDCVWAGTQSGLFCRVDGQWRPVVRGMPLTQINALLSLGKALFAAGSSGSVSNLIRTVDGGESWSHVWIDQIEAPITCMVASPNFQRSGVILAGTYGEGILRTKDGGRFWHLSNFGLQDFAVLALAVAQDWTRREIAYIATETGVYRSPNGGRAWKLINRGLGDVVVQSLLVHPTGAVIAGTEADGIFVLDEGKSAWRSVGGPQSINSLGLYPQSEGEDALIAASSEGVFRSHDLGVTWERLNLQSAALSIGMIDTVLFAGLMEEGLAESPDCGTTWKQSSDFTARRLTWLASTSRSMLFAAGPSDGVWKSSDGGKSWDAVSWPSDTHIYGFGAAAVDGDSVILVASSAGILRMNGGSADWQCVLSSSESPEVYLTTVSCSTAFATDGCAWAGNSVGQMWASTDFGETWIEMSCPFNGKAIVAITPSSEYASDRTLLVAGADLLGRRVLLWRSTDSGTTWQLWLDQSSEWLGPRIAAVGNEATKTGLALGTDYMHRGQHDWHRIRITSRTDPVVKLLVLPGLSVRLAVTSTGIFVTREKSGKHWQQFDAGMQEVAPSDVIVAPSSDDEIILLGLSSDGRIWRRPFL